MSIPRQLFALAVPIIGINVLNVLMLAVDSALCGRLPDSATVLAALGYAVQIIFLLMVVMLGLLVGTVALVARAYGGKAIERVNELLVQSTQLTVLVGVVIAIAGALLSEPILQLLGGSQPVVDVGVRYLRPLMLGTPLFYLGLLYAGVLRGVGNTRLPFACAILANVVNAVLNYGLVLGNLGMPALGVTGSALGTVCAQIVNTLALIYVLRSGRIANVRLRLRPKPIDRQLAIDLFRVGWPAALDLLILNAGFLTALGILGRIDDVTVAAHGLGLRVQALAFVPGIGISQATGALVGQAGARRRRSRSRAPDRSRLDGAVLGDHVLARGRAAVRRVPAGRHLRRPSGHRARALRGAVDVRARGAHAARGAQHRAGRRAAGRGRDANQSADQPVDHDRAPDPAVVAARHHVRARRVRRVAELSAGVRRESVCDLCRVPPGRLGGDRSRRETLARLGALARVRVLFVELAARRDPDHLAVRAVAVPQAVRLQDRFERVVPRHCLHAHR